MMYCHVSQQIADYAAEIDADEAVNLYVDSLMSPGNGYDPHDPDNFSEAVGEMTQAEIAVIAGLLRCEQYHAAGKLIDENVTAYWSRKANDRAMFDIRPPTRKNF